MTNERNDVLKPCPFCGGDGEMAETSCFWVVCDVCGAEGPTATKEAKAASLWNAATQTQPAPVPRDDDLMQRLVESRERIGDMCAEGRPPRMQIPANPDDDDLFIVQALRDAEKALSEEGA